MSAVVRHRPDTIVTFVMAGTSGAPTPGAILLTAADISSASGLDREMELSIGDNADHLLESIDAALARVSDGTYGNCERCGQAIAPDRLEALPWATKCIECKRLEERG